MTVKPTIRSVVLATSRILELGYWLLEFVWNLFLGYWLFEPLRALIRTAGPFRAIPPKAGGAGTWVEHTTPTSRLAFSLAWQLPGVAAS